MRTPTTPRRQEEQKNRGRQTAAKTAHCTPPPRFASIYDLAEYDLADQVGRMVAPERPPARTVEHRRRTFLFVRRFRRSADFDGGEY
jgi:hypothetical protein